MWKRFRIKFFAALLVPTIVVAILLTWIAVNLFRKDKELYVFDSSAQSVELVSRILLARINALKVQALQANRDPAIFLSVETKPVEWCGSYQKSDAIGDRFRNISSSEKPVLEVQFNGVNERVSFTLLANHLFDLKGFNGPAQLTIVNRDGVALVHSDERRVINKQNYSDLITTLKLFDAKRPRVGTRQLVIEHTPMLVAYARVSSDLAVFQAIGAETVVAASRPLTRTAIYVCLLALLIVTILAIAVGRRLIKPIEDLKPQIAAIGRGEFGGEVATSFDGPLGDLMRSLNEMSVSLKKRECDLKEVQSQLLQAERLNTAGRMIDTIAMQLAAPIEACSNMASKTLRHLSERSDFRPWQYEIVDQANRAANILQNLKRIAALQNEDLRPFDVDLAIADVIVSARPLFEKSDLKVESQFSNMVIIRAKANQFHNAMLDLFLFVTERTKKGTTIAITLKSPNDLQDEALLTEQVTQLKESQSAILEIIYVSDGEGSGIAESKQTIAMIGGESRSYSNLGLAIATTFVEDMKGSLQQSVEQGRNVIRIRFPEMSVPDQATHETIVSAPSIPRTGADETQPGPLPSFPR